MVLERRAEGRRGRKLNIMLAHAALVFQDARRHRRELTRLSGFSSVTDMICSFSG